MKARKQKKSGRAGQSPAPSTRPRRYLPWVGGGLAVAALAGFILWQNQPSPVAMGSSGPPSEAMVATNAPASTTPAPANFPKLKGKWQRTDGDYVIDIKTVEDSGKLSAAYLNPSPIHVAKAEATHDGGATKVFIELQDVNYPGCTYTLVYLPERDLLAGVYYQALQRQSYEVFFERMK
jgi:hypothetical protein